MMRVIWLNSGGFGGSSTVPGRLRRLLCFFRRRTQSWSRWWDSAHHVVVGFFAVEHVGKTCSVYSSLFVGWFWAISGLLYVLVDVVGLIAFILCPGVVDFLYSVKYFGY